MSLIQPILVALFISIVILYWARIRTRSLDRLIVLSLATLAIALVAIPELSTQAAEFVGVGRGSDLVTYLSLVGIGFLLVMLFSRVRALQEQVALLVREIGLRDAVDGRHDASADRRGGA